MKIAFTYSEKEFNSELLKQLKINLPEHELIVWERGKNAPSKDIEVILAMGVISREQMADQPGLLLIQTVSAGYEGIDINAAAELGIWVSYAPSELTGNAISVAEFAVMLILGASRYINQVMQPPRNKTIKAPGITPALHGKTICIIGLGTIGRLLAERLVPFGMRICATDDHPKEVPAGVRVFKNANLAEALTDADFAVLCIRATKDNENMITKSVLDSMKKGAMVINIARGSLVDEAALAAAIVSGHIAAAGLDVVKNEPVSSDNPLLNLPQVLITPHVAGTTDITLTGTVDYVIKALADFIAGKRLGSIVNQPVQPRHGLA